MMQDIHTCVAEMKSWLGWSDADSERLAAVRFLLEPHLPRIIDRFYEEIERHAGAAAVFEGPAQVLRLKITLRRWLIEVFEGPHDIAYALRRQEIGHRHVKVSLPDRYMFLAMHTIESEVALVLCDELDDPFPTIESLRRVLSFDLALMTGTFISAREDRQLDSLQAVLVRHLRVSVLLLDQDGIVRSATPQSARLAGDRDLLGSSWTDVLPDALIEAGKLEDEMKRALETGHEVTLPRVDACVEGSTRSFRVNLVPLHHERAAVLIQLEELTDAVEMEARVRRSEALAQLGALSAAVSHELRNPLAGISGALQVIAASMDAEAPHRRIIDKVQAEVGRLNALVSDLLAFSRTRVPSLERLDLRRLAEETVDLVEGSHEAVFHVLGEGKVVGDPDFVRQILLNLLRNAADAGQTVRIEVGTHGLRVSDDGPGVPASRRAEIFRAFVTTKARGTGLGLAISRQNAEAMQATLELVEGMGSGACFELRFR